MKMARTPGLTGPGFELDLLRAAIGNRPASDVVLQRQDIEQYGRTSWEWRILIDGNTVAHRLTQPMGDAA